MRYAAVLAGKLMYNKVARLPGFVVQVEQSSHIAGNEAAMRLALAQPQVFLELVLAIYRRHEHGRTRIGKGCGMIFSWMKGEWEEFVP